jgi:hypothetical protein
MVRQELSPLLIQYCTENFLRDEEEGELVSLSLSLSLLVWGGGVDDERRVEGRKLQGE